MLVIDHFGHSRIRVIILLFTSFLLSWFGDSQPLSNNETVPVTSDDEADLFSLLVNKPIDFRPLSTFPIDPEFTQVFTSPEDSVTTNYSWSHCFSNSNQFDGWRTTSCFIQNLCFNTTSKEFLFYAKSQDHIPDPVSIPTFNYKWGKQYDKTVKFIPKIRFERLLSSRLESSHRELWIPFLPFCPANIGHLIWDDYLTLFLLSWTSQPFISTDFMMRPLWYNPPDDPPWATCDWIRLHEGPGHSLPGGYSDRCIVNNKRWLSLLLGPDHQVMPEMNKFKPKTSGVVDASSESRNLQKENPSSSPSTSENRNLQKEKDSPATSSTRENRNLQKEKDLPASSPTNELVCFPRAAYGITPFANQASGHHGWNPTDPIAPSFGRAPELFSFTRHMMRKLDSVDVAPRSLTEIVVFFSSSSSHRLDLRFDPHVNWLSHALPELQEKVDNLVGHDRLKIVVKHEVLAKLSAKDQMKLTSTACAYITAAGGGAFTAQFLPRGSSIILYHSSEGEHLHKGRVDWKFFNAATWMRSTYLDASTASDLQQLVDQVTNAIFNCVAFMEALRV